MSVVFGAHDIITQAEGNPTRFFINELIIVSTVETLFYGTFTLRESERKSDGFSGDPTCYSQ